MNSMKNLLILTTTLAVTAPAFAYDPVGIPNYEQVNANLYRGGRPEQAGLAELAKMGVKTVINLQGGDLRSAWAFVDRRTEPGELPENIAIEGEQVKALHMNYINFPIDSVDKIDAQEDQWIKQILVDVQNPALQPVFVHCEHGKDRTGLIVALERVQFEKWSPSDAHAEWVRMGHDLKAQIFTGNLDRYFNTQVK